MSLPATRESTLLLPHHVDQLHRSALTSETILARGYASMAGSIGYDQLRSLGFSRPQSSNLPGLLLPVWGSDNRPTDLAIYRPDTPRPRTGKDTRKYEFPAGRDMRLDVPPAHAPALGSPDLPLWITEGQKKGDALASAGAAAVIALLGVDCWRGKNALGGTTALADWEHVHLRNRQVHICYDSDVATKPQVASSARRLANFLRGKGAQVDMLLLPPGPDGQKQGIDDFLAAGGTLVEALVTARDPWQDQPQTQDALSLATAAIRAGLPQIRLLPGELGQLVGGAQQAILDWQSKRQPVLFQRAGRLCFIVRDGATPQWLQRPPDLPQIQPATRHKLRALANEAATWWGWDGRKQAWRLDLPPHDIMQTLLDLGEWCVPPLTGIATRPFLRPDMSVCQAQGYDRQTGIYLEPTQAMPPLLVPEHPTHEDAVHSLLALRTLVEDFPFATPEEDFAVFVAALLTLVARPAIDGQTPLFAVTSSTPGSGKGLLVDLLCLIATGEVAARWAPTHDPEEERKRLTTIALAGEQVALIDNVSGVLGSEALDMAITSGTVSDRAMATHTAIRVPFRTVLFATGNNVSYRGDMARRVVPITLASTVERPEERTDFHQPQIRRYCRREQHRFLGAALTVLRAYAEAGMPPPPTGAGSFEAWSDLARGAVLWGTGTDPLSGRAAVVPHDPELEAWGQFLAAWHACYGAQTRTLGMAVHEIEDLAKRGELSDEWRALREAMAAVDPKGNGVAINTRALGRACQRYKGRIVGGRRLTQRGTVQHLARWIVETP